MSWGPAVSALKKLWKSYKIAGRTGEPRGDIAWKINRLQSGMGIEKSTFPELEGMETDDEESQMSSDEELTREEEVQLRNEENQENEEDEEEADDWCFS